MEMKFYRCSHCGQIIAIVKETGVPVVCCGEPMAEVIPGTTDASLEKHVPFVNVQGNTVHISVGSAAHPMLPEHYIEWVAIQVTSVNSCLPATSRKSVFLFATAMRLRQSMHSAICILSGKLEFKILQLCSAESCCQGQSPYYTPCRIDCSLERNIVNLGKC